MKASYWGYGFAVGAAVCSANALAGNFMNDTHIFNLGYGRQDATAKVTASVEPLPPIEIDLQDDLNVDNSSESVLAAYHWRFAERWVLGLTYQNLKLNGGGAAGRDFNFDGDEYQAGAQVDTEFTMATYRLDVAYAIVRNEKWELLLGAGIHTFVIETSLAAQVFLAEGGDQEPVINQFESDTADVLAPLPNVRAAVNYLITPNWSVRGGVGWLGLSVDNFSGSYTYANVAMDYRITERFGFGASYQVSEFDAKISDNDGFDEVDIVVSGPSLYLVYGF